MTLQADILLITVTDVESRAVMDAFREATGKEPKPTPLGDRLYLDLSEINGSRVFMTISGMGTGGVGGSQEGVRKGVEALSPQAVIMVGIAFGVNERKQAIGDVLVSERLMLYDLQRVGTDDDGSLEIIPRGDRPPASPWLVNKLRVASLAQSEEIPEVRFGLVLSGDKLVDNIDFRDQLRALEQEAIGGEMEGAGLYVACQNSKVDWALVKGICDWADGRKSRNKTARQELAAANAASFVVNALQQAPLERSAPSPRLEAPLPTGTPPAHEMLASTLPAQHAFFGREQELEVIREAISPAARTWGAMIDGPGGIGKTALAIHAARCAPAADFDRTIFLSAKVRELTPAGEQELEDFLLPSYLALITELGRELGDERIAQVPPNERANEVRRTLAGARALIVFDNVETLPQPERVRLYQFLSRLPAGSKAIVTSRRRADIDARLIRLDRLARDDAHSMMAELSKNNRFLAGSDERERDQLYETTNGNPLLIRWAVGQLGRAGSRCRTIADACDFLEAAPSPDGNDPLEYIFGDLLDTFTENETGVLAALTYFTQPVRARWVANVANIAEPAALTALEDLTDRALLVADAELECFGLPPLAATFLRRARPEVIARAGERLTDRVYAVALEHSSETLESFGELEAEWPAIAASLPVFAQGDNGRLQGLCGALERFLYYSGRWDEQLELCEQAEERALGADDFYHVGWRAYDVGWVYLLRGQADEAIECASRCGEYWERAKVGAPTKAYATRLRALALKVQEDYPAALVALEEALSQSRAVSAESRGVADTLADVANVRLALGDDVGAERAGRESMRIAEKLGRAPCVANATSALAEIALERGDWKGAATLARDALEQSENLGHQEWIGTCCSSLAAALARGGAPEEGLPYARRAVEILTELRARLPLADAEQVLLECSGQTP